MRFWFFISTFICIANCCPEGHGYPGEPGSWGRAQSNGCMLCDFGWYNYQNYFGPGCRKCIDLYPGTITLLRGTIKNDGCVCQTGSTRKVYEPVKTDNRGNTYNEPSPCNACRKGTYKDTISNQVCTNCPLGKFTPGTGSMFDCAFCPDGQIGTDDKQGCRDCDAGTSSKQGSNACFQCNSNEDSTGGGQCKCTMGYGLQSTSTY